MVKDKSDKAKIGNWIDGDTFALKIENSEYPEYNGKYIILINTTIKKDGWKMSRTKKVFRAKLTQNNEIPKTKEEIEFLKYIKTGWCGYLSENYKFPKETQLLQPDEYHMIYKYVFIIHSSRYKIPEELIYLGNYDIKVPENEYIPKSQHEGSFPFDWKNIFDETIQEKLIVKYKGINLKEYPIFSEERQKTFLEREQKKIEIYNRLISDIDFLVKLDEMGILESEPQGKRKNNSITYVGGEAKDPSKSKKKQK